MDVLKKNSINRNKTEYGFFNQSIYNSKKVNEQLKSTSNFFMKNTPYLSKSFGNNPIENTKMRNIFYKIGSVNFSKKHKSKKTFGNSFSNRSEPKPDDREKLSTYYKLTDYNDYEEEDRKNTTPKRQTLPEFKERDNLFFKYNILSNSSFFNNSLPKISESTISCTFFKTYFNSSSKAKNTILRNKQIVSRMNDITNYFVFQKYRKGIEEYERKKYFLKKMPKIHIKNIDKSGKETIDPSIFEFANNRTDENGISKISINIFKKVSFNGMLASNTLDIQKISKKIIHEVNALITYISPAFKPYSRTDFTVNIYNDTAILFGGLSSGYLNDMWEFNFTNNKWKKIKIKPDNDVPVPRYSHTTDLVGNYLVIFGGYTPKNYEREPEQLILFDLEQKTFIYPKLRKHHGYFQRKGHISVSATNSLLIYGGMNVENGEISNSAYILDLNKFNFEKLDSIGLKLPYLIDHSAVMVNNFNLYTNKPYSFYKIPEDLPNIEKHIIYGVYIFGGANEKGELNNNLFIISIGKRPCKIFQPEIDGIPPEPRMNCKMQFILSYDFIIIHGGTGNNLRILNDIMILNTESFNWIKPIFENGENAPKELIHRTGHEMFFNQGKIYILGGRDQENYLKMGFECIQFEITNF